MTGGFSIPRSIAWLRASESGRAWLDDAPRIAQECAERWQLALGDSFEGGMVSIVLAARRVDGSDAVLKLQWPHPECEHEAAALRAWNGEGAVRLLEHDHERDALLLERCLPGTSLATCDADEALTALVDLLPRLWIPAGEPFSSLEAEAAQWRATIERDWEQAGRPFERRLVDAALEVLDTLPATQPERVLISQDLHGDNVLRASRGWLAIDPKPLVGERALSLAGLVRAYEFGHSRREVLHRLDVLTSHLGVDRERARLWTVAQTVAWNADGTSSRQSPHIETARWLLDAC